MDEKSEIRSNKLIVRMTGLIMLGILSLVTIIGLFWGRETLATFGIIVLAITIVLVFGILFSKW